MSFADIAEECGESKSKIWKRYKALERKKIITGFTIQINFAAFGFDALATLLINVEAQQTHQVMDYIEKITEIRAYRQYYSLYNIRAVTTLENLNDLGRIRDLLKLKLPTFALKTYIWTGVRNIPENLSVISTEKDNFEKNEDRLPEKNRESVSRELDKLDLQIAQKLTLMGRTPFSEIAQELKMSTDTVTKRYNRLRKCGVLKASIQIDPNKIGYEAILDFNIAFSASTNLTEIVDSLARIRDIIVITQTSGDYDLQLTAMVKDINHSFAIQEEISRIIGVMKMEVSARKIPTKWPTPRQHLSTF